MRKGNWGIAKGLATAVLGQVRDSSSENGVTTSAINTANITIRDEAAQQQRTGKSAEQTITEINHENIHQSVNKVDIDKVKSEFERDLKTATDFVKNVSERGDQMYYNMEKNEDSIFSTQKEREDCNRADCLDYKADNSQSIQDLIYGKDILSEEQALALSRFSTAGMLNLDRADKVSSAILYDDKNLTSIDETAVIINRGSEGFVNEFLFTGFERFRAWVDMPAIFGASNATRDKVQLLSKINEYNAYALENGKRTIDLNSIAHSLGVSGDKNALNWARYLDKDFKNSRIQFTHLAGSYSSNEIDTEARKLFKDVQTKYIGVDNDPVYRGLPLLRSIGFGLIGNNDKPVKGNGIGMGVAHSQANQNIYNLNLVYGNDKKGTDEKNKAHNVLDKVYPHNRERIFNIIPYKDGSND